MDNLINTEIKNIISNSPDIINYLSTSEFEKFDDFELKILIALNKMDVELNKAKYLFNELKCRLNNIKVFEARSKSV